MFATLLPKIGRPFKQPGDPKFHHPLDQLEDLPQSRKGRQGAQSGMGYREKSGLTPRPFATFATFATLR